MNHLVLIGAGLLLLVVMHVHAMPTAEEVLTAVKEENAHKISKRSDSDSSGGRGFRRGGRRRGGFGGQSFPRRRSFSSRQRQFFPSQPLGTQFFPQPAIYPQYPSGRNSPQIQTSQIVFPLNVLGPVGQRGFRGNNFNQPYGNHPYGNRPYGNRPYGNRPYGNIPFGNRPYDNGYLHRQPFNTYPLGGNYYPNYNQGYKPHRY